MEKKKVQKVRLNKYIASCGFCSRRKADEYIEAGKVRVNGEVITELGYAVPSFATILRATKTWPQTEQ